ncbi:MAG TPA: serine/threonine-protein kinase, partial [Nannocystaceae bacterium]|nr:serine/threonine-protein kinase [Nannocystaceae bacterium]
MAANARIIEALSAPLPTAAGFTARELLHEGSRTVVCRATRDADGLTVILKLPRQRPPTALAIGDFRREHKIASLFDDPRLTRVLGLVDDDDDLALVIEDFPGVPLHRHAGRPIPLLSFFALARQIAAALGVLHNRGIIH